MPIAAVSLLGVAAVAAATASTDTRGGAGREHGEGGIRLLAHRRALGFGAEDIEGFQFGLSVFDEPEEHRRRTQARNHAHVDDQRPANAVTAAKDLIGQGYKIIAGSTSSASALPSPDAAQNNVLFISGAAATTAITGRGPLHVPLGPPDLPGRPRPPRTSCAKARQEGRRLRRGLGLRRRATSRPWRQVFGGEGYTVREGLRAPTATDFTPFAPQLKTRTPTSSSSPGPARTRRDVAGAPAAERVRSTTS